ncbi:MAG TPA: hypothetical protein PKZ22_05575 [Accumulibacter sp.]|jgi:hypothetical protein|nr:hypothetical protein [Accumulibacter sp.]
MDRQAGAVGNWVDWAARNAAERLVAVGVLAVRPRRYASDGAPAGLSTIAGLRVRVATQAEKPHWHASTGIYGFLHVPPGEFRIEVDDPTRRYLPQAVSAQVPDRSSVGDWLTRGVPPPTGAPGPLILDLAMRPSSEMPLPPASTALWGVLRESAGGRPVPGALLSLTTVLNGANDTVTTLSGADGGYLLVLPGEAVNRAVNPPLRNFERALTVRAPLPPLAAALADKGFLAGQPAGPFALGAADRDALFVARDFQLRAAGGGPRPRVGGQNPSVPVSVGERRRWDIELLP